MAILVNNRVQETCSAPGTGTVTLLGAVSQYRSFSAGIGSNNLTYYVIADQTGTNWEVGIGTVGSTGTTLARTIVLDSSNGGSLTNFSSGTQAVWVDYPANAAVLQTDVGTNPNQIPLNQYLGTMAYQDIVNYDPSNFVNQVVAQKDVGYNANQIPLNQYLGPLAYQLTPAVGFLTYTSTNILGSFGSSVNSYNQIIAQNSNNGNSASSDFVISNDLGTDSVYYGDFGITSSTYNSAGTNITNLPSTVYLQAQSCGLALGTLSANYLYFVTNSVEAARIDTLGVLYSYAPNPTAVNATATLTIAQLQTKIITSSPTVAAALTLPTGTLTDAGITAGTLPINESFDWCLINTSVTVGAIVTLVAGTGHTIVGNTAVAITTSAQFRTRKTAANTFITYRIA